MEVVLFESTSPLIFRQVLRDLPRVRPNRESEFVAAADAPAKGPSPKRSTPAP